MRRLTPLSLLVVLPVFMLHAESIERLIDDALQKHHSLSSIQHRLSSMDTRIAKSQKWANPDLSLTVNDIQFRKPFSRSEEPMQNQAINFKQRFPWFGKLDARKMLAQEEKHLTLHSLEAARVALAYNIRITAYTVKELELRIGIIHKYIQLAKQNIKLYTDYISVDSMSHADSVVAELSLSKLEIRAERYTSMLKSQKEKLRYLVQKKVKHISQRLNIKKPKSLNYYLAGVRKNPNYHMKLAKSDIAKANKTLIDLDKYPDPYVQAGYFHRTDFPDYASISVGVSLPVYGTETLNSEIAQKELLARQSESVDYQLFLKSQIRENYAKLVEAYEIYRILQNKSLPQLDHMLELSISSIKEGGDLLTYTNILEQKLSLEEERIAIMAESMRIVAKLKSLMGVI